MYLADNYSLEKRRVRHARIRVSEDLSVRVIVPINFTKKEIESLIAKKQKWIDKSLSTFIGKKDSIKLHHDQLLLFGNRYNYLFAAHLHNRVEINHNSKTIQSKTNLLDKSEQVKWYKRFAKAHITQRLQELAKQNKFCYNKVFIRDQRTKWGNCSPEKNLSFNWRLVKTPQFVIEYLILHELAHTRTMNHRQKFWAELRSLIPEYQTAIKWLDKYGNSL